MLSNETAFPWLTLLIAVAVIAAKSAGRSLPPVDTTAALQPAAS